MQDSKSATQGEHALEATDTWYTKERHSKIMHPMYFCHDGGSRMNSEHGLCTVASSFAACFHIPFPS